MKNYLLHITISSEYSTRRLQTALCLTQNITFICRPNTVRFVSLSRLPLVYLSLGTARNLLKLLPCLTHPVMDAIMALANIPEECLVLDFGQRVRSPQDAQAFPEPLGAYALGVR